MFMQNLFAPIMAQAADPVSPAVAAGGVLIFLVLAFILAIAFSAIFIHLAASVLGFSTTFGAAMSAVLWQMLYSIVLAVVLGLGSAIIPVLAGLVPLTHWLSATLGIRQVYQVGYLRALLAALLSAILTVCGVVLVFILLAVAGLFSAKQIQDEYEKRKTPTTSVELEGDRHRSGDGAFKRSESGRCLSNRA